MKRPDIINDLLTRLDRGDWSRGDVLPPLRTLAQEYETNPQTVSNALTALGLLGRVHTTPRGSTVVIGRREELHLGHYKARTPGQKPTGTREWKAKEGDGAAESPTRVEILEATAWLASLLGTEQGHPVVVRHRTRFLNGDPVQYKRTVLAKEYAELTPPEGGQPPMLSDQEIITPEGKSVAQWLGMGVVRIEYRWSLTQADAEESISLSQRNTLDEGSREVPLKQGTPVLRTISRGQRADGSTAYATVTTTPTNTEAVMCIETLVD